MSEIHSGHIGGAILVVGGVTLSVLAIRERLARLRRTAGFLRAQGHIIEIESRNDPVFEGDLYVMVVRFQPISGDETMLRFSRRDGWVPRVGDTIPILYPADAPARGEAESWSFLESLGGIVAAALAAVLGALLLWVSVESGGAP